MNAETTYQINITEPAKAAMRERLGKNPFVRMGVKAGSCDGFSYVLQFENVVSTEKDMVFEFDNLKILIDKKSLVILNDLTVDYKKTIMEEGFQFINKLAKSQCGCGRSFSI